MNDNFLVALTTEDLYAIGIFIAIVLILYFALRFKTKGDKAYDKHLKESLADEFIIDPETGTKITLEEAESGHWIPHDNEFLPIHEKHFTKEEKNAEKALNYLRQSKEYRKLKLSEYQLDLLDKTKILSKYYDWSYTNAFSILYCNGVVLHPTVSLSGHQHGYFGEDYTESQIMFWIPLKHDTGHYYLRNKSHSEKFLDKLRNDDALKIENFEVFTFKPSQHLLYINNILKIITDYNAIEVEFYEHHLFVKNEKFINYDDLIRLEVLIQKICHLR